MKKVILLFLAIILTVSIMSISMYACEKKPAEETSGQQTSGENPETAPQESGGEPSQENQTADDSETVAWDGLYVSGDEKKSLYITGFDGESFNFSLNATGEQPVEGTAMVYADGYAASYMDLTFAIGAQERDVSIWLDGDPQDGFDEREPFVDVTYFRAEDE